MDRSQIVGKELSFMAAHRHPKKGVNKTWMRSEPFGKEGITLSGYFSGCLKKGEQTSAKVVDAYFMEGMNGGRTNQKRYDSPEAYFADPQVKEAVMRVSYGDTMERLCYTGDPDEVELVVELSNGEQLSQRLYNVKAPIEWYSEKFSDHPSLQFNEGFYPDADTAVEAFSHEEVDDLFGTRYFPVLVFPESTGYDTVEEVACEAKNYSNLIVKDGQIIVGLRCKPCEYEDCIRECYDKGGQVPVNRLWDWS